MKNMSFEQFKEWTVDVIEERMPGVQVDTCEFLKLGNSYTALFAKTDDQKAMSMVNLDELYQDYLNGREVHDMKREILDVVSQQTIIDTACMSDYEAIRKRLFFRTSNAESNKVFLKNVPHMIISDFALTYHIQFFKEDGIFGNVTITNDILSTLGVTKEQLHSDAMENAVRLYQPYIIPLQTYVCDYFHIEPLIKDQKNKVLIITNQLQQYGASVLFYPNMLEQISKLLGGDYYLIPSSIHEWLACRYEDEDDYLFLHDAVLEVNEKYVEKYEWLSDMVYHYDAKWHIFEHADSYRLRKRGCSFEDTGLMN